MAKRLTRDQISYIEQNYLGMPQAEIARHLGIGTTTVSSRIQVLTGKKVNSPKARPKHLKEEHVQYIRDNMDMDNQELATKLGVSIDTVKRRKREIRAEQKRQELSRLSAIACGMDAPMRSQVLDNLRTLSRQAGLDTSKGENRKQTWKGFDDVTRYRNAKAAS